MPQRAVLDVAGAVIAVATGLLVFFSRRSASVPLSVFLLVTAVSWAALLWAYGRWRTASTPFPKKRLVAWAIFLHGLALFGRPVLEDDHYRYLWDGRQFAVQGTPYGPAPIASFNDPSLPDAFQRVLDNINHPQVATIYGPGCQALFLLAYWIAPGQVWPLQLLLTLADLALLALLLPWTSGRHALLYAWCPLAIKETCFTAHPDALGVLFLFMAVRAYKGDRWKATALWCAAAVATRVFALLIVPFLLLRQRKAAWLVFALALGSFYAPFLWNGSGGGAGLAAFLGTWEFNSSLYGFLAAIGGPAGAKVVCAVLFGVFYAAYLWRFKKNPLGAVPRGDVVFAVFFLTSAVVNPWYLLWMAPFVSLRPTAWGVAALAAVSLSYTHGLFLSNGLPSYHHPSWLRPLEYGAVAAAGAVAWFRRRASARSETARWR